MLCFTEAVGASCS